LDNNTAEKDKLDKRCQELEEQLNEMRDLTKINEDTIEKLN